MVKYYKKLNDQIFTFTYLNITRHFYLYKNSRRQQQQNQTTSITARGRLTLHAFVCNVTDKR